jgi:hypothetical protein
LAQSAARDLTKFRSRLLALWADLSKQFPTIFPSKSLFFGCGGPRLKHSPLVSVAIEISETLPEKQPWIFYFAEHSKPTVGNWVAESDSFRILILAFFYSTVKTSN